MYKDPHRNLHIIVFHFFFSPFPFLIEPKNQNTTSRSNYQFNYKKYANYFRMKFLSFFLFSPVFYNKKIERELISLSIFYTKTSSISNHYCPSKEREQTASFVTPKLLATLEISFNSNIFSANFFVGNKIFNANTFATSSISINGLL